MALMAPRLLILQQRRILAPRILIIRTKAKAILEMNDIITAEPSWNGSDSLSDDVASLADGNRPGIASLSNDKLCIAIIFQYGILRP